MWSVNPLFDTMTMDKQVNWRKSEVKKNLGISKIYIIHIYMHNIYMQVVNNYLGRINFVCMFIQDLYFTTLNTTVQLTSSSLVWWYFGFLRNMLTCITELHGRKTTEYILELHPPPDRFTDKKRRRATFWQTLQKRLYQKAYNYLNCLSTSDTQRQQFINSAPQIFSSILSSRSSPADFLELETHKFKHFMAFLFGKYDTNSS